MIPSKRAEAPRERAWRLYAKAAERELLRIARAKALSGESLRLIADHARAALRLRRKRGGLGT